MFDKLKQSLPESLRKKMGAEETHGEESAEYSEEESEESHDTSANEPTPEDKKKKQISMLIRVIAVVALGYMALTEFVFKLEPENAVPAVAAKPRKPRVRPNRKDAKKPEEKTAEVKPGESKPDQTKAEVAKTDVSTPKAPETQPPVENINIADKAIEKAEEKPAEKVEVNVVEKAPEKSPEKPIDEKTIDETPVGKTPPAEAGQQVGEVKSNESQVDKSLDSLIDNMDKGEPKTADTPKKSKLEEKIVVEEAYTPPPAYDQLGRGLVYNCKDKYWACLDRNAFVACNKNMKWNKSHGKAIECAVQNVYTSEEDCNTVQKYNVSMGKPTNFCN